MWAHTGKLLQILITYTTVSVQVSEGRLTARAGEVDLITVQSPKLCEAIFDMYIGNNPVSKKAKAALGESAARMMGEESHLYSPDFKGMCAHSSDQQACSVQAHPLRDA